MALIFTKIAISKETAQIKKNIFSMEFKRLYERYNSLNLGLSGYGLVNAIFYFLIDEIKKEWCKKIFRDRAGFVKPDLIEYSISKHWGTKEKNAVRRL